MTQQQESSYFLDAENVAEMARLTRQARVLSNLTGLVSPWLQVKPGMRVLDIACGPGEWMVSLAQAYPDIDITGIDLSHLMTTYARAVAEEHNLQKRVRFLVMDARFPLDFPDQSFDIIHARYTTSFMKPDLWPGLLSECYRVLKPGGRLMDVELDDTGSCTSPALTRFMCLWPDFMRAAGYSFNSEGNHSALIAVQPRLFKKTGFQGIRQEGFVLNYSYGTPSHEDLIQDWASIITLGLPLLSRFSGISLEDLEVLKARAIEEMRDPTFCACGFLARTSGKK